MRKLKIWLKKRLKRNMDRLMGGNFSDLEQKNNLIMEALKKEAQNQDRNYRDLIDLVIGEKSIRHNKNIKLVTEHPVAYDSIDHIEPWGTIDENTRHYGFYRKCRELYGTSLSFLDLGCAGGGMVFEFALNGHVSIGLEGSDTSKVMGRANWRTIPDNLFCCNITKEFELLDCTKKATKCFDVISCWEVLEHIPEDGLETFFLNVKKHSDDGGIFVGSISRLLSSHHITVHENDWWIDKFSKYGFRILPEDEVNFEFYEFCRPYPEVDILRYPELGFHFVAQKK